MRIGTFLFLLLAVFVNPLFAQELVPIVKQFDKNNYNADNQNWSVSQAADGRMYFGNNKGLLRYDGLRWSLFLLPLEKTVRSVFADKDGRVYVGSFEEFGYFKENEEAQLEYLSLSDKLSDFAMKNDEIWTILRLGDKIYFQSFSSYFVYDTVKDKVYPYRPNRNLFFFHILNDKIHSYVEKNGYSNLSADDKTLGPIKINQNTGRVVNAFSHPQNAGVIVLVTQSDGLWLLKNGQVTKFITDIDAKLSEVELNRAILSASGVLYLGTILDGLYAINLDGKLLWHISMNNVLQNNTILGLYEDTSGQIWLAMDKGIAKVDAGLNLKWLPRFQNSVGAVYDMHLEGNRLLTATNQGLYQSDFNVESNTISNTSLVSHLKGQIWDIAKFDQQIICSTNEKTYVIDAKSTYPVSSVDGGMCLTEGVIHGKNVLLQGTYSSICVYLEVNDSWTFSHTIPGFINPVSHIEIDYTGRIWISHMHKGLYLLQMEPDLRKISTEQFFKSLDGVNPLPVRLFKLNNRVVFTDSRRFYTYDDLAKGIVPYNELNQSLGYFASSHRISHFRDNLYWFIKDKVAGLFLINGSSTKLLDVVRFSSFDHKTVDQYQKFNPISEDKCLITLENGFGLYVMDSIRHIEKKTMVKLSEVMIRSDKDSVSKYLKVFSNLVNKVPFSLNNITFSWYYPDYSNNEDVLFSYIIEGMDSRWSEPSAVGSKNYNYLPAGDYTFKLRAVTFNGNLLSEMSFPLVVLEPFYWTLVAKLIYLIVLLALLWFLYFYLKRKYQKRHERLRLEQEEIQKREIELRENQINLLEKEKLETELTLKSKELAQSTMTIINKNEILSQLRDELNDQKLKLGSQYPKKYFDKLMSVINENLSSEDDWNRFQSNFDMIHQNFFRHLHRDFPELTPNDLRFCAYLRLNLTSKDIANLMNITIKGVEVARYRIRKKINLASSKSLAEFMIEYK